ncbi:MAG: efflux RND transporter periplasmic adaptor subunit [Chitinophagaceae bacterium]|nr:efflux RND transporter periplasmic adaptor subunit [Chitinophagaceae bacterium]
MKRNIIYCVLMILFGACTSKMEQREKQKPQPIRYALATVEMGGLSGIIKLPAQLNAYQEVSIFPKVNGYVKAVFVDIGTKVKEGASLMTLEAPELELAVSQARERYVRTRSDLLFDKEKYNRLIEASATEGAISPIDISTLKAKIEADSALCNAEKANWQIQQTMLSYLHVKAPFEGIITERNVHPGALVSASTKDKPMLELKQIVRLRLQVDVPEDIAVSIKNKDTVSFFVSALQGKKIIGTVNRKSMNVNTQFRSERIEVDVKNQDGLLSSGMYADVIIYYKGGVRTLYVPKTAVIISTEKKYVLCVRNGKVVKVDVSTGNATVDKVEVYGLLQKGDIVITNANDEIPDGLEIGLIK